MTVFKVGYRYKFVKKKESFYKKNACTMLYVSTFDDSHGEKVTIGKVWFDGDDALSTVYHGDGDIKLYDTGDTGDAIPEGIITEESVREIFTEMKGRREEYFDGKITVHSPLSIKEEQCVRSICKEICAEMMHIKIDNELTTEILNNTFVPREAVSVEEKPKAGNEWRPKEEEEYFRIMADGSIKCRKFKSHSPWNKKVCDVGNCYRTREIAERVLEVQKFLMSPFIEGSAHCKYSIKRCDKPIIEFSLWKKDHENKFPVDIFKKIDWYYNKYLQGSDGDRSDNPQTDE